MKDGLHPRELVALYDCLREFKPFRSWRPLLPPSDAIQFVTRRLRDCDAQYIGSHVAPDYHVIEVNPFRHGHFNSLASVMAHEMIHLYQAVAGLETKAMHNADFHRRAKRVCAELGFDPKQFVL